MVYCVNIFQLLKWIFLQKDKLREEIPIRVEEFKSECDRLVSLLDRQDAEIFRKALVIGW